MKHSIDHSKPDHSLKVLKHSYSNDYKVYDLVGSISNNNSCAVNFVMNDYLALGNDNRIKLRTIRAIHEGIEFVKTIEIMNRKAEEYLSWIFDKPVLLFSNSAMVHGIVMQSLIDANDVVIFDDHVHPNLRISADLLKPFGQHAEKIEHNNIQHLEERINLLKKSHARIWYVADSIYSSPGDVFPLNEIKRLLNKYEQFYVYVDDSRGMSWTGENGEGYVHCNFRHHSKVILSISLSKGFGCEGGVLVCYNEEIKKRISNYLESATNRTHFEYAILSSIIESAKIHLSNEIYERQLELQKRITVFNNLSQELGLPIVSSPDTPVAFFVTTKPEISQEICFNLFEKGYYLNVANFPLVPYQNSGIMANVTLYQEITDITSMLKVFKEEYCKVLKRRSLLKGNIFSGYKKHEYAS